MKQAILTLLSSLIHSLKQESARYHSLILPLIQGSVNPESVSLCPEKPVKTGEPVPFLTYFDL